MERTNHYHLIAGDKEFCTTTAREAFTAAKGLTHGMVTSKAFEGRDTVWTLTDGSRVIMRPAAAH